MNTLAEIYVQASLIIEAVSFCICTKRIHGRTYYYKQTYVNGAKTQKYIRRADEGPLLEAYARKQEAKEQRRSVLSQVSALPPEARREFRQQVKLYRRILAMDLRPHYHQMPNGHVRDSKSEMVISLLMDRLGIPYKYGQPLWTNYTTRWCDFQVGPYVWEHMGMLDKPDYAERQRRKIAEYAEVGYHLDQNLFITTEGEHGMKTPLILWEMVKRSLVSARKVMRVFGL